jgi:hypothetical protein
MPNDDSKPLEPIECQMRHLEPAWNLKLSALKVREVTPKTDEPFVELVFTFAFTNDAADVAATRRAFQPFTATRADDFRHRGEYVAFYFFDAENVILAKPDVARLEGAEITGKTGDAFRAVVTCRPDVYVKATKVEPRVVRPADR